MKKYTRAWHWVMIAIFSASLTMVAGCGSERVDLTPEDVAETGEETEGAMIAIEDLSSHNSADDCWLAIDGMVYDMTDFISRHPGGDALLQGCGGDATSLFESRPMGSGTPHSSRARSMLDAYFIGTLAP